MSIHEIFSASENQNSENIYVEKLYSWCIASKKKKKSQIGNITKIWKVKVQFHGDEGGKDVCVVCVPECVYVCVLV